MANEKEEEIKIYSEEEIEELKKTCYIGNSTVNSRAIVHFGSGKNIEQLYCRICGDLVGFIWYNDESEVDKYYRYKYTSFCCNDHFYLFFKILPNAIYQMEKKI